MIQGISSFIYRINGTNKYVSFNLINKYETTPLHIDVNLVKNNELNIDALKSAMKCLEIALKEYPGREENPFARTLNTVTA